MYTRRLTDGKLLEAVAVTGLAHLRGLHGAAAGLRDTLAGLIWEPAILDMYVVFSTLACLLCCSHERPVIRRNDMERDCNSKEEQTVELEKMLHTEAIRLAQSEQSLPKVTAFGQSPSCMGSHISSLSLSGVVEGGGGRTERSVGRRATADAAGVGTPPCRPALPRDRRRRCALTAEGSTWVCFQNIPTRQYEHHTHHVPSCWL